MKKIVIITAVKNECDIIELFCRYNLSFCDCLLIYENHKSSDNTREIVQNLIEEEGLPIYFEAEGEDIYYEKAKGILADIAVKKYKADIVIQLDADEFLCHTGNMNLREILEVFDEETEYQIPWRTYVYQSEPADGVTFSPENFTHYRNPAFEKIQGHAGKTIASRFLIIEKGAKFHFGGHWLVYPDEKKPKKNIVTPEELVCAHFPVRNHKQAARKAILNYINKWTLPDNERPPQSFYQTFQLGMLYNDIKNNGEIQPETIKEVSIVYSLYFNNNEEDIDILRKSLGNDILIKRETDILPKIALKYECVYESDKVYLQALLNMVDAALHNMDDESREKSDEIRTMSYNLDITTQDRDRLRIERAELCAERDRLVEQIEGIYGSTTWKIGSKIARIYRFFVKK